MGLFKNEANVFCGKEVGMMLAVVLLLALSACGGKTEGTASPQQAASAANTMAAAASESSMSAASASPAPAQQGEPGKAVSAADGTLTLRKADIAVVVNRTAVPMPYHLKELEAAGVPADETRSGIELGAGDFFSANLYLDENKDYVLIPAYYNGGDAAVGIAEAEAEEITMTTYADELEDQGVSILGVSFGMPADGVKALFGEPMYDDGGYCEWHIEVPDIAYEGTLSMYFAGDAEDAGVSQVNLTVFKK